MIAYFDCYSGISGDMTLGAMVDAGLPIEQLAETLRRLPLEGYELCAEKIVSLGITGTKVSVRLDHQHDGHRHHHEHRRLVDIQRIIDDSTLSDSLKSQSLAIFGRLAEAEAAVHGCHIDEVHCHEVGAVDTIVDVVGAVIGLDYLGIDQAYASPLPLGFGTITCQHGILPVPAPAVLELCRRAGAPVVPSDVPAELVTPTGAAILVTLATFDRPRLRLRHLGYGFGMKELPWPNALRLWVGEEVANGADEDVVSIIESNVDDMPAELLGAAMDILLEAGALDVSFQAIQMKKNRPAVKISVIAQPSDADRLATLLLEQTTSLGVRVQEMRRVKCRRWSDTVATPWGPVMVKYRSIAGHASASPEYEDCLRIARAAGVSLSEVYAAAIAAVKATG